MKQEQFRQEVLPLRGQLLFYAQRLPGDPEEADEESARIENGKRIQVNLSFGKNRYIYVEKDDGSITITSSEQFE
jgi:hypothetical protein